MTFPCADWCDIDNYYNELQQQYDDDYQQWSDQQRKVQEYLSLSQDFLINDWLISISTHSNMDYCQCQSCQHKLNNKFILSRLHKPTMRFIKFSVKCDNKDKYVSEFGYIGLKPVSPAVFGTFSVIKHDGQELFCQCQQCQYNYDMSQLIPCKYIKKELLNVSVGNGFNKEIITYPVRYFNKSDAITKVMFTKKGHKQRKQHLLNIVNQGKSELSVCKYSHSLNPNSYDVKCPFTPSHQLQQQPTTLNWHNILKLPKFDSDQDKQNAIDDMYLQEYLNCYDKYAYLDNDNNNDNEIDNCFDVEHNKDINVVFCNDTEFKHI